MQNIKYKTKNSKKGFALIEALTILFIFSLIVLTFYSVFTAGTRYIIDAKNRLGAVSVANERMEIVRNLKYDDIGTVGGAIEGIIPQEQDVLENGRTYHVKTEVSYVQDPLDGVAPEDIAFADYKKVTVIASWKTSQAEEGEVRLTSRFVPPGLEVADPNEGILSINIFSDQPGGTGIPGADVHIVNTETGLNTTLETDSSGNLTLMGDNVTQSIQKYQISVSKSGYENVATMAPYPDSPYNPLYVHASVILGSINVSNIVQNELADLTIKTENGLGEAVSGVDFTLVGGKMLGTSATFPYDPVYNINDSYSTDSSGEKDLNNISPGQFSITPSVPSGYELISINPTNNFPLYSDPPLEVIVRLAIENTTSLLVKVQTDNDGTLSPISGAQVKLTNASGYDATEISASNGAAYFPVSSDLFLPGEYELRITAEGFSENVSTININQDELKNEEVTLTPTT